MVRPSYGKFSSAIVQQAADLAAQARPLDEIRALLSQTNGEDAEMIRSIIEGYLVEHGAQT